MAFSGKQDEKKSSKGDNQDPRRFPTRENLVIQFLGHRKEIYKI
jgi:hypothetical protein